MISIVKTFMYSLVLLFGFLSVFPNIMMSDNGSKSNQIASSIGLGASVSFILSGIIGLFNFSILSLNLGYYLCIFVIILQITSLLIISNVKYK